MAGLAAVGVEVARVRTAVAPVGSVGYPGRHPDQGPREAQWAGILRIIQIIPTLWVPSADMLLLETDERGPDGRLKRQFAAISKLAEKEPEAMETMIAGVLHRHDAKRWTQAAVAAPAPKPKPKAQARAGGRR